jgi:hypothetical protein
MQGSAELYVMSVYEAVKSQKRECFIWDESTQALYSIHDKVTATLTEPDQRHLPSEIRLQKTDSLAALIKKNIEKNQRSVASLAEEIHQLIKKKVEQNQHTIDLSVEEIHELISKMEENQYTIGLPIEKVHALIKKNIEKNQGAINLSPHLHLQKSEKNQHLTGLSAGEIGALIQNTIKQNSYPLYLSAEEILSTIIEQRVQPSDPSNILDSPDYVANLHRIQEAAETKKQDIYGDYFDDSVNALCWHNGNQKYQERLRSKLLESKKTLPPACTQKSVDKLLQDAQQGVIPDNARDIKRDLDALQIYIRDAKSYVPHIWLWVFQFDKESWLFESDDTLSAKQAVLDDIYDILLNPPLSGDIREHLRAYLTREKLDTLQTYHRPNLFSLSRLLQLILQLLWTIGLYTPPTAKLTSNLAHGSGTAYHPGFFTQPSLVALEVVREQTLKVCSSNLPFAPM